MERILLLFTESANSVIYLAGLCFFASCHSSNKYASF